MPAPAPGELLVQVLVCAVCRTDLHVSEGDLPVRWSCRTGVCHTCETAVISGTVSYAPAPVDDPADGSALICCSQPRDDLVLDL